MKKKYMIFFKCIKVKQFYLNQNNFKTYCDFIEKKKKINHISYSLPIEKENEKYNFEILMKTIKNRADEYNLIKIKEIEKKILIHLKKFTINEVISMLIYSFKYNILNSKILYEITEYLFQNSCFLNSNHLYVLILINKQLQHENFHCLLNEKNEIINKTENFSRDINENFFWKKKYYREIKENIFSSNKNEDSSSEEYVQEIENNAEYELIYSNKIEISEKNTIEKEINTNNIYNCEINKNQDEDALKKFILNGEDISMEMKKMYLKIKSILLHNYNNIYLNIKNHMYTSMLLLNYIYDENIIKKEEFLKNIYHINVEFNLDSFNNNKTDKNACYSNTIINSYIQEQCKSQSIYDLYILTHFNLLKKMLKKSNYINDDNILEKIENEILLDEDTHINKKLYIDAFRMFFL